MMSPLPLRDAFFAAKLRSQNMARLRLESSPEDVNALFAMTLSLGMEADYAAELAKLDALSR